MCLCSLSLETFCNASSVDGGNRKGSVGGRHATDVLVSARGKVLMRNVKFTSTKTRLFSEGE